MVCCNFYDYVKKFGSYQKRSMFGGYGIFFKRAMYALVVDNKIFIRGGGMSDDEFAKLKCEKYRHVKKQTIATVNYYNITHIYESDHVDVLESIINKSIQYSLKQRAFFKSSESRRLRDLPNMQLTLERMVKRSGIQDVSTFMEFGAEKVFSLVQNEYGKDVDIRLLWKFAGAVDGIHWTLLQEPRKKALLSACTFEDN